MRITPIPLPPPGLLARVLLLKAPRRVPLGWQALEVNRESFCRGRVVYSGAEVDGSVLMWRADDWHLELDCGHAKHRVRYRIGSGLTTLALFLDLVRSVGGALTEARLTQEIQTRCPHNSPRDKIDSAQLARIGFDWGLEFCGCQSVEASGLAARRAVAQPTFAREPNSLVEVDSQSPHVAEEFPFHPRSRMRRARERSRSAVWGGLPPGPAECQPKAGCRGRPSLAPLKPNSRRGLLARPPRSLWILEGDHIFSYSLGGKPVFRRVIELPASVVGSGTGYRRILNLGRHQVFLCGRGLCSVLSAEGRRRSYSVEFPFTPDRAVATANEFWLSSQRHGLLRVTPDAGRQMRLEWISKRPSQIDSLESTSGISALRKGRLYRVTSQGSHCELDVSQLNQIEGAQVTQFARRGADFLASTERGELVARQSGQWQLQSVWSRPVERITAHPRGWAIEIPGKVVILTPQFQRVGLISLPTGSSWIPFQNGVLLRSTKRLRYEPVEASQSGWRLELSKPIDDLAVIEEL